MKKLHYTFIAHAVLLMLASTGFSIVWFFRAGTSLSWRYATYSYRNGFGYAFVSEYTLAQVLTYIAAYVTGIVLFGWVYRRGAKGIGGFAIGLCLLGTISFAIEGTHWLWAHHLSLVLSFPIVLAVLWILLAIRLIQERDIGAPIEPVHSV